MTNIDFAFAIVWLVQECGYGELLRQVLQVFLGLCICGAYVVEVLIGH